MVPSTFFAYLVQKFPECFFLVPLVSHETVSFCVLKFLVHLAGILGQCDIPSSDADTIRQVGNDLLKFLSDNVHTFFLSEYEQPPLEYMKETGLQ